jgi:fimbrial isopeptide formation D2 family protein/LPXTG-motif cell wall-anchored protein
MNSLIAISAQPATVGTSTKYPKNERMKNNMKKVLALALAAVMVLSLSTAFAATVTVSNPGAGKTYHFYKTPFEVTYDATDNTIVSTKYTKTSADDAFYAAITDTTTDPASPFTVTATTDANVFNISATNAAAVRAWLVANLTLLTDKGTTTPLTSADDGFYLMTVAKADGTLENATTFVVKGENINIVDKNQTIPGPDKTETIDGTEYYEGLGTTEDPIPTARIGETVTYKVTGTFPMYIGTDLVKKLTFTDTMSKGLTFDGVSSVTLVINEGTANEVTKTLTQLTAANCYSSVNDTTKVTTLTVILNTVDDSDNFLFQPENTYTLTYTAKINEDSIEVSELEENTVTLHYDAGNRTDIEGGSDNTKVKQYDADIVKVDGSDYLLNGATFKVYEGDTALKFVEIEDGVYRLAKTADETGAVEELAPNGAKLTIKGLENGTYSVDEVQVPAGYNRLTSKQSFTIANANLAATITADAWTSGGVKVINNAGTELPSTGGIGTTIFYISGLIMVLGAATILISRRRAESK